MAKKKMDKDLKIVAEAISYMKSCRENAPLNPRLSEDLRSLEDAYHKELFELVKKKISQGK